MEWIFSPEALKKRRKSVGWSARELAHHAGINHATVSRIEAGQRTPNAEIVGKLASALDVDPNHFFAREFRPGE